MEVIIEEHWNDGPSGPPHYICLFRINAVEEWASIQCNCGWELMAGSVIELFEEYRDHCDVLVQMTKYLKEHDELPPSVEPGNASTETELPG